MERGGFLTSACFAAVGVAVWLLQACARPGCDAGMTPGTQRGPMQAENNPAPPRASATRAPADKVDPQEVDVLQKIKARRSAAGVRYVSPNSSELELFGDWFRSLVEGAEVDQKPSRVPPAGFELDAADARLWIAGERATERRGAGAYALRAGVASRWVVQAPHTFFDVGTLEIALDCFHALNARALFVNTVRRSNTGGEDLEHEERAELARSGEAGSDLAHAPLSFFTTAHAVLARAAPPYAVLQIHGFRDELLPGVSAVVSAAGTNASVIPLSRQLQAVLGRDAVRLYPSEVRKLGGTRNVQAQLSKREGAAFIHLELSRTLRRRLRAEPELARTFNAAIRAGALATAER